MKPYLDIYWAFFKTTIAVQFQYRVAMGIWMIGRILEPIVYLVIWSTVARARGGSVGGYNPADFAAYYIVLMIVNQFTFTWIMHEYDSRVRQGVLSNLLLKPIHPIHSDIADNVAYKVLMSVIIFPTAVLLYYLFNPSLVLHLQTLGLFLLALTIAFLLRFFVEWILAMSAFWTTRTDAVNQMFFTPFSLSIGPHCPHQSAPRLGAPHRRCAPLSLDGGLSRRTHARPSKRRTNLRRIRHAEPMAAHQLIPAQIHLAIRRQKICRRRFLTDKWAI